MHGIIELTTETGSAISFDTLRHVNTILCNIPISTSVLGQVFWKGKIRTKEKKKNALTTFSSEGRPVSKILHTVPGYSQDSYI